MMCNVSLGNKESNDFEFWMWCNVVKRIENITIVGNWPIHGADDEITHLIGHGLGSRSHNFIFTSSKCFLFNLNVPHLNVPPGAAKFS